MTRKTATLSEFLTEAQLAACVRLFELYGTAAVTQIQAQVIHPNMPAINEKLGQENDARYLAYAVVHALSQTQERGVN